MYCTSTYTQYLAHIADHVACASVGQACLYAQTVQNLEPLNLSPLHASWFPFFSS